jgi:hypothetical protein
MQFSLADSSVKVGRFCDVSGNNFVLIFRCAGVLVALKLMVRCPALCCLYVEKYREQGRTTSHQFWFHQHTSTPAHPEDEGVSSETLQNLHILTLLSARGNYIEFCRHESCQFIYMKTIFVLLPKFFVVIF